MNILITSAGQRVSLVRAFQRELKNLYPGLQVFATDMCPQLSAACNIADRYFQVQRVTDPGYIAELLDLCLQHNVRMVVPTIDTELMILAENKPLFEKTGIHIIISSTGFIEKCRDKRKINVFFQQLGIDIPAAIDKHHPHFPLFIKPHNGSLSVNTFVVHSALELKTEMQMDDSFLFMEYLDKADYDEYTVDMYYDRSGYVKCIVPRKRILVRAGEINKGITCKNAVLPFLKEKLNYIEGASGCITMQCFLHKITGHVVAIEINARFGGGFPLSYLAGANYPLWLIQEYYSNQEIPYTDEWEDELLMLRYDDEIILHAKK